MTSLDILEALGSADDLMALNVLHIFEALGSAKGLVPSERPVHPCGLYGLRAAPHGPCRCRMGLAARTASWRHPGGPGQR